MLSGLDKAASGLRPAFLGHDDLEELLVPGAKAGCGGEQVESPHSIEAVAVLVLQLTQFWVG